MWVEIMRSVTLRPVGTPCGFVGYLKGHVKIIFFVKFDLCSLTGAQILHESFFYGDAPEDLNRNDGLARGLWIHGNKGTYRTHIASLQDAASSFTMVSTHIPRPTGRKADHPDCNAFNR